LRVSLRTSVPRSWIERLKPARAVLTNMHADLDYEALRVSLPPAVDLAPAGKLSLPAIQIPNICSLPRANDGGMILFAVSLFPDGVDDYIRCWTRHYLSGGWS